ncbi:MAG: PEGA domain-containing protein [Candidatus Marinimicrobia bacterium]|nr:PEGA domain-containing protein [Candidatus Neomarinimicrobiota bacterium]MBT6936574.1 PEGA domain-containing protein [Candidatus Neomarinimicrobiota bacterium]MBT6940023.1 PEGA domain-containing protein [Candidatus Neomarinimicrobiota bacterium]
MKRLWAILTIVVCSPFIIAQETIAVVDFDGKGVSVIEASALTDRFASELFNLGVYRLIERERVGEILEEQGFQQSGCTTAECAVEVGQLLGTEKIITGSISKVGNVFSVSSRIISVESGEIYKMSNYDYQGDIGQLLMTGMRIAVNKLISGKAPKIIETIKVASLIINEIEGRNIEFYIRSMNGDESFNNGFYTTPIRFENVSIGSYSINMENSYYEIENGERINYNQFQSVGKKRIDDDVGVKVKWVELKGGEIKEVNINLIKSKPVWEVSTNVDGLDNPYIYIDTGKVDKEYPNGKYYRSYISTLSSVSGSGWQSGSYKMFIDETGYDLYSDTLVLEEGKVTKIKANLIRTPGDITINSNQPADFILEGQNVEEEYTGKTSTTLKRLQPGTYKLSVQKDGFITSRREVKMDYANENVFVTLVSRDSLEQQILSLEQQILSLKRKQKMLSRGGLILIASGGLTWFLAEKNYEKYQTAGADADKVFSTVETQDILYPIFISAGSISLLSRLYFQLKIKNLIRPKIKNLNKILDDGVIEEQ